MKILIISQFFPPDITAAAFRVGETAAYLAKHEHFVRVITAEPHKALPEGAGGNQDPYSENIRVFRSRIASEGKGGLLGYLRHYLSFMAGSLKIGIAMRLNGWKPDILWVTSPPLFTSISGSILSKVFGCSFVLDIRDIWPDSAVSAKQISGTGVAFKIGKVLEKLSYLWADCLTTVSNPMAEYIQKRTRKPVHVIYNGISKAYLGRHSSGEPVNRVLYAGNLGRVQGLEVFVQAFSALEKAGSLDGWHAMLIGSGANRESIAELVSTMNLNHKIQIRPPVEKSRAISELADSRLLFINLNGDDVFKLTIPSKVFDYMAVGRPILAGLDGEARQILESTGANIVFQASDGLALQSALAHAINNIESLEKNAHLNRKTVSEKYTREQSCMKLASVFHAVLREDPAK